MPHGVVPVPPSCRCRGRPCPLQRDLRAWRSDRPVSELSPPFLCLLHVCFLACRQGDGGPVSGPAPPAGRLRAVRPAVVGPGGWGSPCTGASEHQPAWSPPLGSGSSSRSGGGSWGSRQDAPQDRPEPSRPGAESSMSPRPCSPALGRHAAVLSWARSGSYGPTRRRVKTAVGEGGVRVWRKALVAWPRGRPSAGPPGFTVLIGRGSANAERRALPEMLKVIPPSDLRELMRPVWGRWPSSRSSGRRHRARHGPGVCRPEHLLSVWQRGALCSSQV